MPITSGFHSRTLVVTEGATPTVLELEALSQRMYLRFHRRGCACRAGVLELDEDGERLRLQHAQHEVVQRTRSGHIGEQLKREAPAARAQRPQAAEEDLVFCSEGRRCALQSPQDGRLGTETIAAAQPSH
ncbi:Protein of unknown function [Gryllus bimaculatus]|nr:Protein of unknown function [Gryllus bimaculatus]